LILHLQFFMCSYSYRLMKYTKTYFWLHIASSDGFAGIMD